MIGYRIFFVIIIPATYFFCVNMTGLFSDSSTSVGRAADWREYIQGNTDSHMLWSSPPVLSRHPRKDATAKGDFIGDYNRYRSLPG